MESTHDVVIVGGGAAGLSAALVLGRARRRVAVIDAGSPRNAPAAHMQGYLSRDGLPPTELLAIGRDEVATYGVDVRSDTVRSVERPDHDRHLGPTFDVALASGVTLTTRRLLLTTGVTDVLPDVDGARERWGRDLLHCPYCHGWEVRDQPLAVLATVPGSVQHALLVRQWSDDVVFFAHGSPVTPAEHVQLEARGIEVVHGEVRRLVVAHDRLAGVELADGRVVARAAVFIRPVHAPHADGLPAQLGCETDSSGLPTVDAAGRTTVEGVWAAGNVVDPRGQVIAAAGAANTAGIALNADLVAEDTAFAVRAAVDGRTTITTHDHHMR